MKFPSAILILILAVYGAYADGFPIKNGRYDGKITVLVLTSNQTAVLKKDRTILLTSDQKEILRRETKQAPAELLVYDLRTNESDCTCHAFNVAFRFSETEPRFHTTTWCQMKKLISGKKNGEEPESRKAMSAAKTVHESALRALIGLRLRCVGSAADMLWIHFGEFGVADVEGESREVGEWALHLQCPWRFIDSESIVLASMDFYYSSDGKEDNPSAIGGESLFNRRATQLNRVLEAGDFQVTDVLVGACGAFQLIFTPYFQFAVFPASSDGSSHGEFWRLFQPGQKRPHYVVAPGGIEEP